MWRRTVLELLAAALIQTAPAQTPPAQADIPQWQSATIEGGHIAALDYGAYSLSVLCQGRQLSVIVTGLPPVSTQGRILQTSLNSPTLRDSTWRVASDPT